MFGNPAWRRVSTIAFAAVLVGVLWSCGVGGGGEERKTGASDAVRLVVLSPGLASVVRELGRAEVLVGRHSFDAWTDASVSAVGDNLGIDYERLMGVEPSVVVMEAGAAAVPARLGRVAAAGGFGVERVAMLSLDDVRASIGVMDRLSRGVGVDAALSSEAEALLARFDGAFAFDEGAARGLGRVVVIGATGPLSVTGPGSFHHDLVVRIGGEALPSEGGAWMTLGAEDVAALAPETLVVLAPGEPGFDAAGAMPALASALPGLFGDGGRVIVVDSETAMLPGPGLIGVAERIKAAGRALGAGR